VNRLLVDKQGACGDHNMSGEITRADARLLALLKGC